MIAQHVTAPDSKGQAALAAGKFGVTIQDIQPIPHKLAIAITNYKYSKIEGIVCLSP